MHETQNDYHGRQKMRERERVKVGVATDRRALTLLDLRMISVDIRKYCCLLIIIIMDICKAS